MDRSPILPVGAYVPHPHAELFPMMDGEAFAALTDDIREHGIREPVVMLEGMVLDGRNRYLAARECGAMVPTVEFDGDDPLAFVISLNLKRRHLTESQRATVAARIANAEAGRPSKTAPIEAVSQERAADLMNVSRSAVQRATTVIERGTPALVAEVDAGKVTVSAAAEVARLPEIEQVEIVAQGPEAIREVAAIQREDIPAEEKAELRRQIVEAAEAGLKPARAASRRNPDYAPNPMRDAALAVADRCREVTLLLNQHPAAALYGACLTDGERARLREAIEGVGPAIQRFLEVDHVRAA